MSDPRLRLAVDGGVATVTLDRPEKLNALDRAMVAGLDALLAELDRDTAVRAIVLAGSGRAFSVGSDIDELLALDAAGALAVVTEGQVLAARIERMAAPVLAALNGYALGGGLELALAADVRVAAESAVLGLPEVRIGQLPGWGGMRRLAALTGFGRALDLVLTGRRIGAAEALAIGIVERVVPDEALLPATIELATTIAANSPAAVREARRLLRAGADERLEVEAAERLLAHADRLEGMRALKEKRAPRWEDA